MPLLIYTLAALFVTWPLVTQLSTHIAGAGYGDGFEYVRLGWWAKYALQHGLNPFYQSLFGYPQGFSSSVQLAQPLIYWPITLLSYIVDPVAAYNFWLLIEVILSGLTAFWLCLAVLQADRPADEQPQQQTILAALIGGLIFMVFPAVQGHLSAGHVNPLANYAVPIIALCLYRIVEGRAGLRTAIIGAIALWIAALGNFTFPVFTLLPLIVFGGGYLLIVRRRALLMPITLRYLLLMFVGGALLSLPFYAPLFSDLTGSNRPAYLQESGQVRYSTDPLSFLALSPFTPWTQAVTPPFSRTVLGTNSIEGTAYMGIMALGLAVIGIVRRRRSAGVWLAITLGCMLFSLGPLLKWQDSPVTYSIDAYESHIVLPWAIFQNLPLINAARTPGRFNMTTGLALGVLAALGLSVVLPRLSRQSVRIVVCAVLIGAILAEYQLFFPFPTTPATLPAVFRQLADRSDIRAVFDVPWDDLLAQKAALYQQTVHHKALLSGYISRRTPVDPAKLALLSDVAIGTASAQVPISAMSADQVRGLLSVNGVDVVVYHWQSLDKATTLAFATGMFGSALYQDDQIGVFSLAAAQPNDVIPLAFTGWWQQPGSTTSDPLWLTGDSTMYVYAPTTIDRDWTLQLSPLLKARSLRLAVDGHLDRAWLINPGGQPLEFWLRLGPGFHTLQFSLPDGCVQVPVAPMCLLNGSLAGDGCRLPDDQPVCVGMALSSLQSSDAGGMTYQAQPTQLSNGMALRGFRAPSDVHPGIVLPVQTEWQAAEKLPGDYHFFVHLLDPQGQQVAQYDAVPGDGTFPTTQWSVPQTWTATALLPLPDSISPGVYSLYAGWYRFPDLTRLSVVGNGKGAADGLVYLRDVEIR